MRNDILAKFHPSDLGHAVLTLTRLPFPRSIDLSNRQPIEAVWAFPLVGVLLAVIVGALLLVIQPLLLPTGVEAALILMGFVALTGALHEDGLADTFDGLWGAASIQGRLDIMKDSRNGTFGTCVLILVLLAQWSALEALSASGMFAVLLTVASCSRVPMIYIMWLMPNARKEGLSASFGRPATLHVIAASIIALIVGVASLGLTGLVAAIAAMLAALPIALFAKIKIGGQTGDILGASQKAASLGALLAILAI